LTWEQRIDQVKSYDTSVDASAQFDGIHLDLEPWIGTGSDLSWADALLDYYTYAAFAVAGFGLTTTADISGDKVILLDSSRQQNLLSAATRIVLLEYADNSNWTVENLEAHVNQFLDAVQDTLSSTLFVIATRVTDFGLTANNSSRICQNGSVLHLLDAQDGYGSALGYGGWATFRYATYGDPNVCPNDCCSIGP
jgi:hypothetical protein